MVKNALGNFRRAATVRALMGTGGTLPFPDKMRCCLTYASDPIQLLDGQSAVQRYQFRGNDLFDPDFTGTGAQPQYFDQLAALYGRFRVYGSSICVEAYPTASNGAPSSVGANVVVVPSTVTLASATLAQAQGLPRAKRAFVVINSQKFQFVESHSTSEILGVKDVEGADRLQALVTTTPAEVWLWAIVAQTAVPTVNASLMLSVRISYDVEFFDRTSPSQSLLEQTECKHFSLDAKTPLSSRTTSGEDFVKLNPVQAPFVYPAPMSNRSLTKSLSHK